jgi:predicted dithiol-disulfide oxidoreductase (DUF899 family)
MRTATREQWLAERLELLEAEKQHTRQGDELARRRQELPWVPVEKEYRFETAAGPATLRDLFGGRSQLLVYHFMFGPGWTGGCPSCTAIADGFNGSVVHLEHHDVAFAAVSRAPIETLEAYKQRLGWSFTWASSLDSDFNFDFDSTAAEEPQDDFAENATVKEFADMAGTTPAAFVRERPGMSAFALADGVVHHTYYTTARGLDGLWGMYQWLDRAPKGRNEAGGAWWRRRDEY